MDTRVPFLALILLASPMAGQASSPPMPGPAPHAAQARPDAGTAASAASQKPTDLDRFMARVLERRDEAWRKLHDYILSETETFAIDGPGRLPINGYRREYTWYVRDGILVRSPLRYDGVAIGEADRRKYEEKWFNDEKAREARARSKEAAPAPASGKAEKPLDQLVDQRGEPRFISEAYFLKFRFEAGNYYLVGREKLEGRDVVRVEYYPTQLFHEGGSGKKAEQQGAGDKSAAASGKKPAKGGGARPAGTDDEVEIDRKLNKVSVVTLWIDPAEYQIVKYTFDNVGFGFLPGRWLLRFDDLTASMTMVRVLDGVWLPGQITMQAGLSIAAGAYRFNYARSFYDYKKAEVGARIRMVVPKQP